MPAIYPISSGRVSDLLLQKRLLSQFEFDRQGLVTLQDRLSTGIRIASPSDDAPAAARAITMQRLLEQKDQAKTNLATSQSYTSATDNALQGVSDLLNNIRAEALGAIDTTTTESQREAVATEVNRALQRLVDIGNQQFRGRYLFAGTATTTQPFDFADENVVYHGNQQRLQSYVDTDFLSETNVDGHQVFGAISSDLRGNDLNPILTARTRLADLHGGVGVNKGPFIVSDGTKTSTVDISTAETVGDVVRLIEQNPPPGRQVVVRLTGDALILDLDDAGAGSLSVREVPGGTTAAELGILEPDGVGSAPLTGVDLNPRLRSTTRLADVLGTRSSVVLESAGLHNDIYIEAAQNGPDLNGVVISFVANVTAGDAAIANYDATNKTLEIDISPGTTTANTVVQAIQSSGVFTAKLDDKLDSSNEGGGVVQFTATATTAGGSGAVLDLNSGIEVVMGDKTHTITFEQAETVEDVVNTLNSSEADLLAEISADGRRIDVRSRLSGADFRIGENGGTTAGQLGIRSFDSATQLDELNFGRGVHVADGTDFVIQRKDGVQLEIDISTASTINDVLDAINNHAGNTGAAAQARVAVQGNGIELFDENGTGTEPLTISRGKSLAAWDLGLIPRDTDQSAAASATAATALLQFTAPNTAIQLTANQTGFSLDGVAVELQSTLSGDVATATFDAVGKRLTIDIDATLTTANTAMAAIIGATPFSATLDTATDPTNDGTGVLGTTGTVATTQGGTPELIRGLDVNPREVKSVFNSLLRLSESLTDFDLGKIERAVQLLDVDFRRLSFARAEIGARGRDFDTLQRRMENEEVEIRSTLSQEIDADLVETISRLSAKQANMEATLRLIGQSLQLTVLSFI